MSILEYTFNLIEEAKKKSSPEGSADKDNKKEETTEQFHERIKFNKWKREMVKKNIIKIGFPKQFFGPHEKSEKDLVQKQKELQHRQAADMAKQQHDLNVLKATPKVTPSKPTSPNLVGAKNATDNVNTNIVKKTQATLKDLVPKSKVGDKGTKLQSTIKLSKGMEKSMGKGLYRCGSCSFPIPRYRGKYPKHCPGCGKELIRNN